MLISEWVQSKLISLSLIFGGVSHSPQTLEKEMGMREGQRDDYLWLRCLGLCSEFVFKSGRVVTVAATKPSLISQMRTRANGSHFDRHDIV